jgi:hypothetical protein
MDNFLWPLAICRTEYERIQQMCLWQRQQLADQRDYLAQQRQRLAALQAKCEEAQIACEVRLNESAYKQGPATIASGLRGPKTGPLSNSCQANARTGARLRTVYCMAGRAAPLFARRVA